MHTSNPSACVLRKEDAHLVSSSYYMVISRTALATQQHSVSREGAGRVGREIQRAQKKHFQGMVFVTVFF